MHTQLMVRLCLVIFVAIPSVAASDTCPLADTETTQFQRVLDPVGLTIADLNLPADAIGLWGGDKYKLKLMDFLRADALRSGPWVRSISAGMLTNSGSLGNLTVSAHSRLDNGVRLGLVADPLEAHRARIDAWGDECLARALTELTATESAIYLADPAYASVPTVVRQAAALVLLTIPEARRDYDQGLLEPLVVAGLDPGAVASEVDAFAINTFSEEDDVTGHEVVEDRAPARLVEQVLDITDWNYLNRGSTLLAIAAHEAQKLLQPPGGDGPVDATVAENFTQLLTGEFHFEACTPAGKVVLNGGANDWHGPDPHLLLLDTGGNDTYASAGAANVAQSASIAIDCSGDDHYHSLDDTARTFGAGVFGTGILIDAAGNDSYSSTYGGQGSGIFGSGLLYDLGGDDTYDSFGNSQGSGSFGTGVLADLAGNDTYRTYKYGQAYGGVRGAGILLDASGNDRYLANMTDHFNGGLYGSTHHVHFVQGSAYGRRADITDGHSWAGGFGMLLDGAGDDFYEADCYGQGNAYWHSCGVLVDKAGNDTYRAGQYSQASAPHFAVGILQDDGGDDLYLITIRQSMAHGRDWSIAWLEDSAGNDWYQGARTTLGVSHVNSVSVFWDKLGDDTYIMKGPGLGDSEPEVNGSPRDWLLTLGLFIDGDGTDGYYLLPGDETYEGSNTFSGELSVTDLAGLHRLDFAGDGRSWLRVPEVSTAPGYLRSGVDLP